MDNMINFNMGCFEMILRNRNRYCVIQINFNMGCFEMLLPYDKSRYMPD